MSDTSMYPDFSGIRALAFDVDGVFTDGGILCDLSGELYRTFDAKDGFAVRMASMNGLILGIITGGRSESIVARFRTCGIPQEDVYLGSRNKMNDFRHFCEKHDLKPEEVLFVGDDIPDISVMKASGIGVCPSDAVPEAKVAADYISPFPGGHGCVRDVVERTLKSQGRWVFDADGYAAKF